MATFFTVRFLIRMLLTLVIFTAVGQIRWNEQSLENRYHHFVNSDKFQAWFWAMAIPLTWTGEQLQEGIVYLKGHIGSDESNVKRSAR